MRFCIIEEDTFKASRDLIGDAPTIDTALNTLTWALARDPLVFDRAEPPYFWQGAEVYIAKTDAMRGMPRYAAWYAMTGEEIHLLHITLLPE